MSVRIFPVLARPHICQCVSHSFLVHELPCRFNERLMLFYTGKTRSANNILAEQNRHIPRRREILREMSQLPEVFEACPHNGNLDKIGHLLHQNWERKKQLASGISDDTIDRLYEEALKAGAIGGKITGAGGAVRRAVGDERRVRTRREGHSGEGDDRRAAAGVHLVGQTDGDVVATGRNDERAGAVAELLVSTQVF